MIRNGFLLILSFISLQTLFAQEGGVPGSVSDSISYKPVSSTYIDSILEAERIARSVNSYETAITGYLPGRYWSFDLRRFIDYNPYEGFRFGAGGRTTEQLSKLLSLGGYLAYSLCDKAFKYSGNVTFNLLQEKDLKLNVLYRDDVYESGGIRFNETWTLSGSAFLRNYMVEVMDKAKETELSLSFRVFKYLSAKIYLLHSFVTPTNNYRYSVNNDNPRLLLTNFYFTETGLKIRYAFNEFFMETARGSKFAVENQFPVIYLNVAKGMDRICGNFDYWRTEVKITKVIHSKSLGDTRLAILGGLVTENVPYSKLYAGLGSYKSFTLESEQSFGTMRFNEFLSDRFVSLFFKQDFKGLLFGFHGKFRPELAVVSNLGFGALKSTTHHEDISFKTFEKGFFESGFLINNIFRLEILRYGVGILYRYGPYAYPKTIDNFAFKFSLQFNL